MDRRHEFEGFCGEIQPMKFTVIAEIGVNWNGDLELAKAMIGAAKEAGCDIAKFQLFRDEQIRDSPHYDKLKRMILTKQDCILLKEEAELKGLEWFASAMYPEAIDLLQELKCKKVKIRYKDNRNMKLIDKALETNMTVLISEQQKLSDTLYYRYHPQIKHMYCLPDYPPLMKDFNPDYAATFDGISDHFPFQIASLAYAVLTKNEAPIIEKHVMVTYSYLEKHFGTTCEVLGYHRALDPIDANVSIIFTHLETLVRNLRLIEQMNRSWRS